MYLLQTTVMVLFFFFFLQLKRFKTYIYLLQAKVMSPVELEPSLVETAIGEDEEISSLQGSPVAAGQGAYFGPAAVGAKTSPTRPVHRSLSDRYSYRAAIYNTERVEYDIIWLLLHQVLQRLHETQTSKHTCIFQCRLSSCAEKIVSV